MEAQHKNMILGSLAAVFLILAVFYGRKTADPAAKSMLLRNPKRVAMVAGVLLVACIGGLVYLNKSGTKYYYF